MRSASRLASTAGSRSEDLGEDELAFALEGVRYAAREVAPVIACLHDPIVAREYASARDPSIVQGP